MQNNNKETFTAVRTSNPHFLLQKMDQATRAMYKTEQEAYKSFRPFLVHIFIAYKTMHI
jgi:hypothetical protein